MKTRLEGSWGEALAAEFLRKRGYDILSMGYRCRMGEIDIIAKDRRYIVFVEVKTRKDDSHGRPAEFVGRPKISRVRLTAEIWLGNHQEITQQPRFDVIEIIAPEGTKTKQPEITHLEDAF